MKKKVISQALTAAMTLSLLAGCASSSSTKETTTAGSQASTSTAASSEAASTEETTKEADTTQVPETESETQKPDTPGAEIPQDYKYYFSFDEADDRVHLASQDKTAEPIVQIADGDPIYVDGVKGSALFIDGSKGAKLDVDGVGEKYTVSFWVHPMRSASYMPTLQYGPDMHGDATGGQHYVNFTWAAWNPEDTSVLEYPCVWSYDQLDAAKWPNFYPGTLSDEVKKWTNVTLTVDPDELSADGSLIVAHLYVNGEEFKATDSEGNERPVYTVFNAMEASDNFDFLLGVNYWDAIFKGAFDEIYIYDYALDAAQAKALYEAGDPNAKFTAPEREIVVTPVEGAVASLGAVDFSVETDILDDKFELTEGEDISVSMKHWSDGADMADNYFISFVDENGDEIARVNADATGTVGDADIEESAFTWTWGNWQTWEKDCMRDAQVKLTIGYDGTEVSVLMENTDYNGTNNAATATFECEGVRGFTIGNVKSYTDIISVGAAQYDPNIYYFLVADGSQFVTGSETVGAEDGSTGFWQEFSKILAVPEGESKEINVTMKYTGAENYNNFAVVLQNVGGVHSADADPRYMEYAVVRPDNFGWGDGFTAAVSENNWDFDTMAADMADAKAKVTVTNNGDTADVRIDVTTADGREFYQSYTGITTGGDLFFTLVADGSSFEVEGQTVGNDDGSSGWWTAFSDVYSVAPGETSETAFKVTVSGAESYNNAVCVITNAAYGTAASARYPDYAEYAALRMDNYGWGNTYGTATADHDWVFEEMAADLQDAEVILTVTNNGDDTADIKYDVTTADGRNFHMYYTGLDIKH